MENAYTFTAIRGVLAGREYYVGMCPAGLIAKILDFEGGAGDLGRSLNASAIPKIAAYLKDNPTEYVMSSIAVAIRGDFTFDRLDGNADSDFGQLIIPMTTQLLVNDGQHRCAAIRAALRERPELSIDSISIVFFADQQLDESKRMFADLNRR